MAIPEKRSEPLERDHIVMPQVILPRAESGLSRHAFAWVCCLFAAMLIPLTEIVIRHVRLISGSSAGGLYYGISSRALIEDMATTAVILTIFVLPAVLIAEWHASRVGRRPWRDRLIAVVVSCLLVFGLFVFGDFLKDGMAVNPLTNGVLHRACIAVAVATFLYHWLAAQEGKIGSARRAFTNCFRSGNR